MADCITSYRTCLESLYNEYTEALGNNPAKASTLKRKIDKANLISAQYWAADADSDEAEKVLQCAKLYSLFTGDRCLSDSTVATSAAVDSGSFTYTDLNGSYVLTITHDLGTELIASVAVIDPDGVLETINSPTIVGPNTITVDFGGPIATGQWTWIVTAQPTI